jgi:hypothetical protein
MSKAILPSPDAPLWARWILTLLLPLVAGIIYLEGQDYDPGLIQLERSASGSRVRLPEALAGLPRFGPIRTYDKDNLYEYVDGHAEYYLSAGFKGLQVMEYATTGAQQPQLVVNLYHMGEPLFAFGVLMDELSPDARPVEGIGGMAFAAKSAFNLIQGPYYVQLSRFGPEPDLKVAAKAVAKALPGAGGERLDLRFPDLGRPTATYFVKEDYHGLEMLDNVLERTFERDGREITAFMLNGRPEKIAETRKALLAFLKGDGIPASEARQDGQDYYRVEDPYEGEWFFTLSETRLLGVFTPGTPEILEAIAASAAKGTD